MAKRTDKEQAIERLHEAEAERERVEALRRANAKERGEAISAARRAGLSLRQIGTVIDRDHARVRQLELAASEASRR